jgi:hypothetical protein
VLPNGRRRKLGKRLAPHNHLHSRGQVSQSPLHSRHICGVANADASAFMVHAMWQSSGGRGCRRQEMIVARLLVSSDYCGSVSELKATIENPHMKRLSQTNVYYFSLDIRILNEVF